VAIDGSFDNTSARFPRARGDDFNATDHRLACRRHNARERRSAQRAGHSRVASAAGNERAGAVGSTHISIDNDRCRQRQSIDGCSSSDCCGANTDATNIAIANASAGSGCKLCDTIASVFNTKLVAYDIAGDSCL
jgi:hypothetical protein